MALEGQHEPGRYAREGQRYDEQAHAAAPMLEESQQAGHPRQQYAESPQCEAQHSEGAWCIGAEPVQTGYDTCHDHQDGNQLSPRLTPDRMCDYPSPQRRENRKPQHGDCSEGYRGQDEKHQTGCYGFQRRHATANVHQQHREEGSNEQGDETQAEGGPE